jgi:Icc-related predicted phosphoesterase
MGIQRDFISFNKWLSTLPHKHKLITAGNHDILAEDNGHIAKALITNGTLLLDESITIDGVNFYLSPFSPEFGRWAFMLPREAMKYVWDKIPTDTNVLVTHGPPAGILDEVRRDRYDRSRGNIHVGCQALRDRVDIIKPKLHIFGHIHEGRGEFKNEHTHFINASSLSASYDPIHTPIVIDI